MSRRSALSACVGVLIAGVLLLPPAVACGYTVQAVEQPLGSGFFASLGMDGGGVSGSRVVYTDSRGGNVDIYCYDVSTGVESRVTTNPALQYNPSISGNTVVYEDRRDFGTSSRIYSYDMATHTEQLISLSPHPATVPVISGRNVVWQYYNEQGDGKYAVRCYNLDSGSEIHPADPPSPADQMNPSIDGENIVWQDYRSGHSEIWYAHLPDLWAYSLTEGTGAGATNPSVSGQYAVWLDARNAPSPVEIYGWDLLYNSAAHRVTNDGIAQGRPKISGSKVVWSDSSSGNPDVYCYDFYANWRWPLTVNGSSQSAPFFSGDKVAWQDARSGASEIYLGELATPRLSASIGPGVVAYGAKAKVTGSLVSVGGTPMANRAFMLEFSNDGRKWSNAPGGATDAAGNFSVSTFALTTAYYLRVNFPGDLQHAYLSAQSAATRVKPRAVLSTPVAPSTMSHTKTYKVYGNLTPKHGQLSNVGTLKCYRLESGRWRLRKSFTLTATDSGTISRYNASVKLTQGKWRMRAYHSDSSHAPTYSPYRRVAVK